MTPEVTISPSRMDLGKIDSKEPMEFWFEVNNQTDKVLDLKPWAACGCTTPSVLPSRLEAHGSAKLKASFDPTGKHGLQEKGLGVTYFVDGIQKSVSATFLARI